MSQGKGYLTYIESQDVGSDTFHAFRVSLAHSDWMDVLFELGELPDELLPLFMLDIPTAIPAIIYEDTTFDDEGEALGMLQQIYITLLRPGKPSMRPLNLLLHLKQTSS